MTTTIRPQNGLCLGAQPGELQMDMGQELNCIFSQLERTAAQCAEIRIIWNETNWNYSFWPCSSRCPCCTQSESCDRLICGRDFLSTTSSCWTFSPVVFWPGCVCFIAEDVERIDWESHSGKTEGVLNLNQRHGPNRSVRVSETNRQNGLR